MLPSKGYFNSLECPFYLSPTNCLRPYCHFKHPKRDTKQENNEEKNENKTANPAVEIKPHIPVASIPEKPAVPAVKHIPIASLPTKPSAISIYTKKPKSNVSQYVPSSKGNSETSGKNMFGSTDYDPSSIMDSSEKTYSRYSYEKGHDSGDEIMENHKSIIETNHLKLSDDGSKSGYDEMDEEMDEFTGEAEFSPPISPKDEEEDQALDGLQPEDIQPRVEPIKVELNSIPDISKESKCKKKRKYAEMNEIKSADDGIKKESVKSGNANKTDKTSVNDRNESSSPKRIKSEKEWNHLFESDIKKIDKKPCKHKDKKVRAASEDKNNSVDIKDQSESKKPTESKKHSSSSEGKKHSTDKKQSEKKVETKRSSKSHSSDSAKHSSSGIKKIESKGKDSTESSKKYSSKSESKKQSSSRNKSDTNKHSEKESSSKDNSSKHSDKKIHSSDSNKKTDKHSSSKKHSSSNHKKSKSDSNKTSSIDKNKKHSSESDKKHSVSSKSPSKEKKHSNESSKNSEKRSRKDSHSSSKSSSKQHRTNSSGKKDSKSKSSHSKNSENLDWSEVKKNSLKRKHSISESSGSVISADEKKETILISDSAESGNESDERSVSPPRVEDILGLSDSDCGNVSDNGSGSEHDEYTPMPIDSSKGSPAYRPSPLSKRGRGDGDLEKGFKATSTFSSAAPEELYTPPTTSKVRIAHVPNVSSFLSAKDLINSGKPVHTSQRIVTSTRIINTKTPSDRVMMGTASSTKQRPQISANLDSVIAVNIRQPGLNNIFDELIKFVDYNEAFQRAVEEETEICNVATNPQSYRNRIALCILRIRKSKGAREVVKKETITSASKPDYTYGLTLYECISKYLLKPEDYVLHGYPLELPGKPGCVYIDKSSYFRNKHTSGPTEGPFRKCINCAQEYAVDEETGMPLTKNDCHHHWGKPIGMRQGKIYSCCKSEIGSEPCHTSLYHVTELKNDDCLEGFVRTRPYPDGADPNKAGIFAMDCEMCFTTKGRDIVRASLLAVDNESVYDVLIKPKHPVLDYCTRFSGITEEKLANVTTSLKDVQKYLLKVINDKTILVGHSLENDLKALKLVHYNVVDTSLMFPHKEGLPYKCALRTLCSRILGTAIQTGENGHDSLEDSRACLELLLHQIKEDCKSRKPRVVKQLKSTK